MIAPTKPANEQQRLATFKQLDVLIPLKSPRFERITRVMAALFDVPIAMVNMIAADTQFTQACFGDKNNQKMARDISFCGHTILGDEPFMVEDALRDVRFKDNPNVLGGLKIRAYAGVPLRAADGTHPGALCLIDTMPRTFTTKEIKLLVDLSAWAEIELNAHQLRTALDSVLEATQQAEARLAETNRINELMVNRELKMVEMKTEIQQLKKQLAARA